MPSTALMDRSGDAGTARGRPAAGAGFADAAEPLTRSLPEQIAARLAERILSGAYAPGERIREEVLATEFAVSRGPAREALRMLEKDGLITILARRGAMVTKLSVDEVREIFEIRAVLNGLRDRSVAESAPARERVLPLLDAEVARLAQCARAPQGGEEYVETVLQINRVLNRATPNRRLSAYLTSLEQQTARYSRLGLSTPERRRQSVQRWQRLMKAIRAGDGAAAEQIARERVLESRDAAIRLLASGTPPGTAP
jgi:DNA-binding GntR family transcriptional regulator